MTTSLFSMILVFFSSLSGSIASVFLKKNADKIGLSFKLLKSFTFLFALFLFATGAVIFIIALKYGDLSVLYPISSIGYIWVGLFSIYFLGEKVTRKRWLGIALIVIGVSLVGFGG